jgi:5-methyltetrahydrofolate--homocysteine methyltransferase
MYAGLNMPIINPSDLEMIHAIYAYRALVSIDKNSEAFIERFAEMEEVKSTVVAKGTVEKQDSNTLDLYQAVKKGLKNMVPNLLNKELEEKEPMVIINDVLIKALNDVGDAYDKGKMYLPQLIASAEAAKEAFSIISLKFPSSGDVKGTVVMCTVKGDVHDIGKNICKVVMESYGYKVIDLGKDTPIEVVVDAYQKYNPDVIGLSALMTTTVVSMEETIKALRKINCKAKIVVGGAVLTEDIAKRIGADYYSKDALDLVNTLDRIIKK